MNFFEQQLRNLTGKTTAFKSTSPVFIGRACFLTLSDGRRARLELITLGTTDHYEALQVTILSVGDGKVDQIRLRFADYFAARRMASGDMKTPYIWVYQGKPEWYGTPATDADVKAIAKAAHDYVTLFA